MDSDSGSTSSDSANSERCPICLRTLNTQLIGTPDSCEHVFCAECLTEWSQNVNTCPVDRQEFDWIVIREDLEGLPIRREQVVKKQRTSTPPEDPTFCQVCGLSDREERMLLCDGCDLGYHLECLDPPLVEVPVDEWYCPECPHTPPRRDIDIIEVDLLIAEAESLSPLRPRPRRLLPRLAILQYSLGLGVNLNQIVIILLS